MSKYQAGVLFALATAVFIGAVTTQAKLFYADGGNALTLMFFRFLCSVLVIGLILLIKSKGPSKASVKSTSPGYYGLTIAVGFVWSGAMICYLISIQSISVSVAVLILYMYPLVVLAVSLISGTARFSLSAVFLFITAFVGLGLALLNGEHDIYPIGLILAVSAMLGAAATFFLGARVAPKVDTVVFTFRISLVGLVMILPLIMGNFSVSGGDGLWALAGATGCYIIAILCQFAALSRLAPEVAAFFLNLEPVVSITIASMVLGESLSTLQWFGVALVMLAVLASTRLGQAR